MNYLELINNFWAIDEHWQFTCCETRLYFYLLKTANRLGWVNNWTHSDAKTSANVGVSANSLKNARNKLMQAGLIDFKSGGKHRADKNRYQILTPKHHPNHIPKEQPKEQPLYNKTKLNQTEDTDEFSDKVVKFFNENCKGLPQVKVVTDLRRAMIMARLGEHGQEAIIEVIKKTAASDFLKGQNQRGFLATFDWIFRAGNFVKTLEGNYDNRQQSTNKQIIGATAKEQYAVDSAEYISRRMEELSRRHDTRTAISDADQTSECDHATQHREEVF